MHGHERQCNGKALVRNVGTAGALHRTEGRVMSTFDNLYIVDFEVFACDWLVVFKHKATGTYTALWNDNDAVEMFMQERPLLAGFNIKHYDQYILKAVLAGMTPEEIKRINDAIIRDGIPGWQIPSLRDLQIWFDCYDLMDDCQTGMSLKAIEAHLGMDIRETTVPFDIDRPLTPAEREEVEFYCKHDVDATERLDDLRQDYLKNKLTLGNEKGIAPARALYMTNAKLTARYLDAKPPEKPWDDEREYRYPDNLLWEYIPTEVKAFFDAIHDHSIPSEVVFLRKMDLRIGRCECTVAFGGIHGAIPCYSESTTDTRAVLNKDVASYYPHLMTVNGYLSRNISDPKTYSDMLERRIQAKRAGDKATANALKLVANTTFGATLNEYNDLYDPLMARSVCISGQLYLLELAMHLVKECSTLEIVQLNTDGIMVSIDRTELPKWEEITREWEVRTGFELEEDKVAKIVQKDVNNYVEVAEDGALKLKGGVLVRGIAPAGAFNVNNNAPIVAKAVTDCLAYGTPVEETINAADNILDFQLIAKSWSKCGNAVIQYDGKLVEVQRVNRVYAVQDWRAGTLYMYDPDMQNYRKINGLPLCCAVDNDNHMSITEIDRNWYIRLARRYVNDFLGVKPKKNAAVTRKINKQKKAILEKFAAK